MTDRGVDGLHISTIIHDLCLRLGHYPERDSDVPDDTTRMQMGCAFERGLILGYQQQYPDRYTTLSELCVAVTLPGDRRIKIYGNVDLYDIWDNAIEEIKLTWASARNDITSKKFLRYWWQAGGYCKMLGVSLARLHIGFVIGDYKGDTPIYQKWERVFSPRELDDNWAMLTGHADKNYDRLMTVQEKGRE